jgi:hypothetical protein
MFFEKEVILEVFGRQKGEKKSKYRHICILILIL